MKITNRREYLDAMATLETVDTFDGRKVSSEWEALCRDIDAYRKTRLRYYLEDIRLWWLTWLDCWSEGGLRWSDLVDLPFSFWLDVVRG